MSRSGLIGAISSRTLSQPGFPGPVTSPHRVVHLHGGPAPRWKGVRGAGAAASEQRGGESGVYSLLAMFWPERDRKHARNALRNMLHVLRRSLGDGVIRTRGDDEVGVDHGRLRCDAVAFERAAAEGRDEEALELYRGHLLEGFHVSGASPELEHWLDSLRDRFQRSVKEVVERVIDREKAAGNLRAAARTAHRAATLFPDDEGQLRRLMTLLASVGDRTGALGVYETFTARLRDLYEDEPAAATVALAEAVRFGGYGEETPVPTPPEPRLPLEAPAGPDRVTGAPSEDARETAGASALRDPERTAGSARRRRRVAVLSGLLLTVAAAGALWNQQRAGPASGTGADALDGFDLAGPALESPASFPEEWSEDPWGEMKRLAALSGPTGPALEAFLRGEDRLRSGRYASAQRAYRQALDADSAFAVAAFRRTALAGRMDSGVSLPMSRELPAGDLPRQAGLLLRAHHAFEEGRAGEAERLYRELLSDYPRFLEGWWGLGEVLFRHGPPRGAALSEAALAYQHVLALDPEHADALWRLASIAASEGRPEEAATLADSTLRLAPDHALRHEIRALGVFAIGTCTDREGLLGDLESAPSSAVRASARTVAVELGDLEGAEAILNLLAAPERPTEMRAIGKILQAHLAMAGGRRGEADRLLRVADEHTPGWGLPYRALLATLPFAQASEAELRGLADDLRSWAASTTTPLGIHDPFLDDLRSDRVDHLPSMKGYLGGAVAVALGDVDLALEEVDGLHGGSSRPGAEFTAFQLSRSLRGQAYAASDPAAALAALENLPPGFDDEPSLRSLLNHGALDRFVRAELLAVAGRTEEALRWYGSFEHGGIRDLIFLAPSHLRRAEIHEQRGNREVAAEHYQRFTELWAGCDGDFRSEMEDARRALARLNDDAA